MVPPRIHDTQGYSMIRPMRALLLASCCLALTACATAGGPGPRHSGGSGEARIYADVWPQAYADLPPDPAMRFGTLPNGLRYVIMKNATPGGQSSLRLRIGAGSLEETPQQQGLAHLLEHMAFNGSSHVPYGDMIKILERHGLAFGADTNAYTAWEETVYKLDLPKSDDDTVDTSLMLLREIAGELNLDQAIMDKEKGVVLSEERLRDTPNFHMSKQSLGLDLQGQLAADRFPIGKVEAIQAATHAILNDYYRRYYRPERAVLIAIGDFDPNAMEAKIKTQFGGWRGVGPAGGNPDLGEPMKRGSVAKLFVEDGVQPLVNLSWVAPPDLSADSVAKRRREVIERLALAVLNRRLDERVRADNPPFLGAGAYREDVFHSADITTLQTSVKPGAWRPGLDAAIAEQRRLERFGVSAKELADAIDTERASRKATAEGAATRTTPSIADDVVSTLGTPEVETSPAEDLALFEADVKGLTAAEVNATLKTVFGGSGPLVFVSSPEPVEGGDKAVSDAVAADEAAPVTAPVAQASVAWPYDSFGPAGVVADRKEITDLDTVFVRFQNGVRLTIKPTKFRDDQILVEAHIGHGRLDRPADRITTDWAAPGALPEGGLGKLTAQQIDEDLRSRILGHEYSVSDDSFSLSGATRQEDLATQLQLLTAYVSDPGFRPEAFARMKSVIPSYLDQLNASPSGVLSRELGQRLRSGDRRWGLPSAAEVAAETADQFKQEQDGPLADGPIEVVIVGDITVDKAIDAVAQTFGALPPRADSPAPASAATLTFPAPTATPVVLTHKGRADQAVGVIAWPTDDFLSDTQRARTLSILSAVLDIRMLDQLRRAEGATYSPYASSQPSSAFPHFGYLAAQVEIPPAKLDGFFKDVAEITADLRTNLVSPDELQRAQAPAVESLLKRRQTNEYWMTALSGAQDDPRKLAAIRSSEAQLSHVTAEDLRLAAQTYLRDDKAYRLVVKPAGAP
jgi:zinc protease